MYKKVVNDDGLLESLNDKRAASIMLLNGLLTIFKNLRSKVLTFNNLEKLEKMVTFLCNISVLVTHAVCDYCKQCKPVSIPSSGVFFPFIRQAWQMEIHSLLCTMTSLLVKLRKKDYFRTCSKKFSTYIFEQPLNLHLCFFRNF